MGFAYCAAVQRYGMLMAFTARFTWLCSALSHEGVDFGCETSYPQLSNTHLANHSCHPGITDTFDDPQLTFRPSASLNCYGVMSGAARICTYVIIEIKGALNTSPQLRAHLSMIVLDMYI